MNDKREKSDENIERKSQCTICKVKKETKIKRRNKLFVNCEKKGSR